MFLFLRIKPCGDANGNASYGEEPSCQHNVLWWKQNLFGEKKKKLSAKVMPRWGDWDGMGWGSDPSTEITMNWIWIPWILCEIKTTSRSLREWADYQRDFLRTSSQLWKFFSLHKAYEMPVRSCAHHLHFDHSSCKMDVRSSNVTFEDNVRELMDPATEHARNHTASVSVPSGL